VSKTSESRWKPWIEQCTERSIRVRVNLIAQFGARVSCQDVSIPKGKYAVCSQTLQLNKFDYDDRLLKCIVWFCKINMITYVDQHFCPNLNMFTSCD